MIVRYLYVCKIFFEICWSLWRAWPLTLHLLQWADGGVTKSRDLYFLYKLKYILGKINKYLDIYACFPYDTKLLSPTYAKLSMEIVFRKLKVMYKKFIYVYCTMFLFIRVKWLQICVKCFVCLS